MIQEINDKEAFIKDSRLKTGVNIRLMRERRGYSQDKLAELMNVKPSTIIKIEDGKFNFSIDYLTKLSWILEFEFQFKEILNNKSVNQI
jgi:DNA-binding XRE family transcriptional regulator